MMELITGLKSSPSIETPKLRDSKFLEHARTLRENKEYSLALALLRQASSLDSENFEVLHLLSEILIESGRSSEALLVKRALKAKYPDFQTTYEYASQLYKSGQSDEEALKSYFECLGVLEGPSPLLFEIYKNMGNISVKLGDFDGAEEFYNKAYTINNRSDVLLVNFGTLEVQRADYNKAVFCFREAVQLNEKNDKAWVGLALIHNEFGDHPLAWANLTAALDLDCHNRTAVLLCAKWSMRDHRESFAIEVLERYLAAENFDEEISLLLINLYCYMNEFAKAQLETTKILAWNPRLPAAREIQKQIQMMDVAV